MIAVTITSDSGHALPLIMFNELLWNNILFFISLREKRCADRSTFTC
ncbi:hypothetical protein FLA_0186 [Filimonas lacunae]|nr:hypothetical protein FLA_0186 [Filimonas lacunae]